MGLTVSYSPNSAFRKVPPGVWAARCVGVVDLGTQEVEFSGEKKLQHKLQLTWEVFGEDEAGVALTIEQDGKEVPLQISKRYTLSLNEKAALRKDLAAWRGRDFTPEELKAFDISKLLGVPCLLNVQHNEAPNGKTYANVASITPLPKGMPKPASATPLVSFDLSDFDGEVFEALPEYTQEIIKASAEYKAKRAPLAAAQKAASLAYMPNDLEDAPFASASMFYDMTPTLVRKMRRYG
jgi:hypothetical protein